MSTIPPPVETPILVQGHFTGNIKMVDGHRGKEMQFEDFEFKFDSEDKINEIATNLNANKTVKLGPASSSDTTASSSDATSSSTDRTSSASSASSSSSSGGKSIKKRVRKNRKTKKHGNKKYRNKK